MKNVVHPPPPEWSGAGAEFRFWAAHVARIKEAQWAGVRCPEARSQAIIPLRALRRVLLGLCRGDHDAVEVCYRGAVSVVVRCAA
eukprot:13447023-Alexandrium_andersonii.AAC.1